jgi:hypothetical protein
MHIESLFFIIFSPKSGRVVFRLGRAIFCHHFATLLNTLDMLRNAGIEDQFWKSHIHITMNMPMTDPNGAAIYGAPWIPSTKTPVMLRHVSIYPSTMDPSWDESNIVKPFKAPYFGGASSHP